jgi:hypothetical protein
LTVRCVESRAGEDGGATRRLCWSSYRATAGKAKAHACLTTDWVRGQALLGEESFMEQMVDHLRKHKDISEIPRSQRFATRPTLAALFPEKLMKDEKRMQKRLSEAIERHGYRQSEIARQVGVHYSTNSRWLREYDDARRKT